MISHWWYKGVVKEHAEPLDDGDAEPDLLDELTDEWTRQNPDFPALTDAAYDRLVLMRTLGQLRREAGLSQTAVAARMGTSQAQLARLEMAESDPRMSTLDRFAVAVGYRLEWSLVRREERGRLRRPGHGPGDRASGSKSGQ